MKAILLITLCALLSLSTPPAQAQTRIVCPPDSKYLQVRQQNVDAFRLRSNEDLQNILINNAPDIDAIYEGCVGRIADIYERARNLIFGKVGFYTAQQGIIGILQEIAQEQLEKECRKVIRDAQDAYSEIADIIPQGDYWIDFDQVFRGAVE